MAVWLSGVSALIYCFSSYMVRDYFIFLTEAVNKTISIILR